MIVRAKTTKKITVYTFTVKLFTFQKSFENRLLTADKKRARTSVN